MSTGQKSVTFYAVYTAQVLGAASKRLELVLEQFKTLEAFYRATPEECKRLGLLSTAQLARKNSLRDENILEILRYCEYNNIRVLTRESTEFIYRLRAIEFPPLVLYARGKPLRDAPAVGIVGTRHPTEFGCKSAYSLAARLSLSGFTVVSGGALGVDTMAHYGALNAGGQTVMVLGCGHDSRYLTVQNRLRRAAEQNGTVLSELPPKTMPSRYTFPIRNRIISALSDCVAVVEAGEHSGALITAGYAMEQGRELFAVPGNIGVSQYQGSNVLIRDGAIPLISADDIVQTYAPVYDEIHPSAKLSPAIKQGYYRVENAYRAYLSFAPLRAKKGGARAAKGEALTPPQSRVENGKEPARPGGDQATPLPQKGSVNEKGSQPQNGLKQEKSSRPKNGPVLTAQHPVGRVAVPSGLSCAAATVLSAFQNRVELTDVLSERAGVKGSELIVALSELELMGCIRAVPVGRYELLEQ